MARLLAGLALLTSCCLAAPCAMAQPTTTVQGLVVVPGPGPAVKSTYPASGETVPSGVMILKVVFDQPMTPNAWAYGPSPEGDFPHCLADPRLLSDHRTFVLLCTVAASRTFAVQINPAPRFASDYGRSAQPFTLKFSTTGVDSGTPDLHDALVQAGLDDTDDPIMTWRDTGQGVSQTAPPP